VDKTHKNPATGKLSYFDNCQALCTTCNSRKG
jgi:5-methylcytosine-specific restriction endonuclease McrA